MLTWSWVERSIARFASVVETAGGGVHIGRPSGIWRSWGGGEGSRLNVVVVVGFTAVAGIALAATLLISSRRGGLKSPWSTRKRKEALSLIHWKGLFAPDGKLRDSVKFLKKVRSGGVDHEIRHEVWPFLLGVYDLNSSDAERNSIRRQKREEYRDLRRRCLELREPSDVSGEEMISMVIESNEESSKEPESLISEEELSSNQFISIEGDQSDDSNKQLLDTGVASSLCIVDEDSSHITHVDMDKESSDNNDSKEKSEITEVSVDQETEPQNIQASQRGDSSKRTENFTTWQRIIRLDAIRANGDWIAYSPSQAAVSEAEARKCAEDVGLKDYDYLTPCRIYHASRLVAVLEAYALYDQEIGYCQGMSDLLTPIIAVMEEDDEAFWCFVGFMDKARHNFRLDEVGIKRQLNIVSKIIKSKDSHLYSHLEKLQAEDCFFVYRMVVVLFRRELTFEQTLCLWEVMWADQAAIRVGIGKSWLLVKIEVPPTEDLLLYAIAASVLQKRKLIIEKYSSIAEIMSECHSMAGQLDVWKLLDDAHDLVVRLHDKMN